MTTNLGKARVSSVKERPPKICRHYDADLLVKDRDATEGAAQPFCMILVEFGID